MKKAPCTATLLTLVVGAAASAQIEVTHSVDNVNIVAGNSVSCNVTGPPQKVAENSYFRSFDLATFPQVTGPFNITTLEVGVESATAIPSSNGEQDITIRFYVDCNGGAPKLADLTLIDEYTFVQVDTGPWIEEIPVDVTVNNDATLVVEVYNPSYTAQPDPAAYFIGSNAAGETAPSYLMSADCGITEITPMSGIGFPGMHIVMTLLGDDAASAPNFCEPSCPCACNVDTSTGPDVCDIFDFLAFQNAFVGGESCACNIDTSTGPDVCDIFDFLAFQDEFVGGCP